jgi:hypothetical protein
MTPDRHQALQGIARTELNQARSVLDSARRVDPYIVEGIRKIMNGVLSPLFLRAPLVVLAAFAFSRLLGAAGVPRPIQATVFWGIGLSLPITVLVMFMAIALWRIEDADVSEKLFGSGAHLRLLVVSVLGYLLAFSCGAIGGTLAPHVFPV